MKQSPAESEAKDTFECLLCGIDLARIKKAIPEGYQLERKTLEEQIELMVEGLKALSAENKELSEGFACLSNRLDSFTNQ